jgi:hypothetical protein
LPFIESQPPSGVNKKVRKITVKCNTVLVVN